MDRDKAIGRWVSIIFRNATCVLTKRLTPLGVGRGQYLHLAELYQCPDGLGQDVLSERLLIDKGTTARALAELERLGLVRRERNPDDRRGKTVHLTTKALELRERFFDTLWSVSEEMVRGFTDQERLQVLDLLRRMAGNVETVRMAVPCNETRTPS